MSSTEKREFLDLISIEDAKNRILKNFNWLPSPEIIPLQNAKGRILAEDITAKIDIPPFDRSRMDGYAVRSDDTYSIDETTPRTFQVIGTVPAGDISKIPLNEANTCIEIATGAPIPRGANAVVMVEYTSKISQTSQKEIEIFRPVAPQENIDPAGSDIMFGETVLRSGDVCTSVRLGILASLGISEIKVLSELKVGILSSGDELRPPGETLPEGCIFESNSIILSNLVLEAGAVSIDLGICPDDLEAYKIIFNKHLRDVDVLLISGGTSAGEGDYSYRIITELGGEMLFHGVSMKPGKPLAVGIVHNKLIITLPGFPASAIFSFNTVIAPLIRRWTETPLPKSMTLTAFVSQKIRSISGRSQFKLVYVLKEGNKYRIYPVKGTSGSVSALERADGYITIPEDVEIISPGESVKVTLLQDQILMPDIIFIGSHDFVIDRLFRELCQKYPNINVKLIFTGSSGGLSAIGRSECDIAGCHLLDSETIQYNLPFIKKAHLSDKVKLIKGYNRIQGFYVPKENPKSIKGIEDLLRPDIVMMNRNEGSGTRILFDILLGKFCNKKGLDLDDVQKQIKGYWSVASSHSATAGAVFKGTVDVSVGIEPYARTFEIDFIPLAEEEYDLLINKSSTEKLAIKELLDIFNSKEFRLKIQKDVPGISWTN
ncbi:MAG: molybdopterin biosynthesis protein [Candidatus Hodarchaeales archaeon]|jgi:putative molybdopterin biosynthesis protein